MTVTLQRQIICSAPASPQGTGRSPQQLQPPLPPQLHSSGGRPGGDRRHSPPPRADLRSPPEGAGQKPPEGRAPALPGDSLDQELGEKETEECSTLWKTLQNKFVFEGNNSVHQSFRILLCDFVTGLNIMQNLLKRAFQTAVTDELGTSCRTGPLLTPAGHHSVLQGGSTWYVCVYPHLYVLHRHM